MLILSRKAGETIQIGGDIELTITSIEGSRVKVGVVAPRSVKILRGELDGEVIEVAVSSGIVEVPS